MKSAHSHSSFYRPKVSIVLPTFNGEAHLQRLLPLLLVQNGAQNMEIVAIDSSSEDASTSVLQKFGARVFSIPQADFGHGKTRNFGVEQARGEIVVFLSQDALPVGKDWLQTLIHTLQDDSLGAVFARQIPRAGATPFEKHLHTTLYPARSRRYGHRKKDAPTLQNLFFSNVCSAARREVCLRFPFDESLIMSEDQFFARDLLLAGYSLSYNARAQVVHSHAYNLKQLWRRNFDSGYSLRGLIGEKPHRRLRFLTQFLLREALFVLREKKPLWLAYLPIYEGTRVLALLAGGQAHRFPRSWNRVLSLHRLHWK